MIINYKPYCLPAQEMLEIAKTPGSSITVQWDSGFIVLIFKFNDGRVIEKNIARSIIATKQFQPLVEHQFLSDQAVIKALLDALFSYKNRTIPPKGKRDSLSGLNRYLESRFSLLERNPRIALLDCMYSIELPEYKYSSFSNECVPFAGQTASQIAAVNSITRLEDQYLERQDIADDLLEAALVAMKNVAKDPWMNRLWSSSQNEDKQKLLRINQRLQKILSAKGDERKGILENYRLEWIPGTEDKIGRFGYVSGFVEQEKLIGNDPNPYGYPECQRPAP